MPKFGQLFSIFSCLPVLVIHSGISIAQGAQPPPAAVAVFSYQCRTRRQPSQPHAPAFATPASNEWPMPGANTALTRFSTLTDINSKNVGTLRSAYTFSMGVNRGQESSPLVIGNTLYVVSPYPNILYALDLSQPGAPLKWSYAPHPLAASQGVACCDVVNRGPTFANGRVFFNTLDGNTIAVDAKSGKEIWRTQMGDITHGETMTMAPLVVKDKLIVGDSAARWAYAVGLQRSIRQREKSSGKPTAQAPITKCLLAQISSRSIRNTKARTSVFPLGRLICGGRAAARFGAGSHTIPNSTSSTTEPPIPDRGIRRCGRATICGRPASSPAMRTRDRRGGSIKRARTTCRTTMA